jgi:Putative papain-like cysteine peptidase (DUF1796)
LAGLAEGKVSRFRATHIVSLGGNCRVTYNLRKTFDFDSAYPFDWWICPLKSATAFLSDPDLDALYDPALLEPVLQDGRVFTVVNTRYDIRLHHEFPRTAAGITPEFREHTRPAKERQTYLLDKFRKLNAPANSILFVRNFINWDNPTTAADAHAFLDVVRGIFDKAASGFLFINPPPAAAVEGVEVLNFVDYPPEPWQGDQAVWRQNLRRAAVDFVDIEGQKFVETGPEKDNKKQAAKGDTAGGLDTVRSG